MDTIQYIKDIIWALKSELLKYRMWVAALFTIVLLVVIIAALNWPKYYVSNAIIVKDVTNVIEPLLRGAAEVSDIDKNEKVKDVIFSRSLLERVVKRVHEDFDNLTPEGLARAVMIMRSSMTIVSIGSANVTRLSYRSATPDNAYKTLTAVVEIFIEDRMADKQKKSHEAHDFISNQVNQYKERLLGAEKKLQAFKAGSVDVTESDVKARISELAEEVQELKISINETEERGRSTRLQLERESESVTERKKIKVLEDRRLIMSDQLDQWRLTYQDSYPDIVSLQAQMDEIDVSLNELKGTGTWSERQLSELPLLEELRKQLSTAQVELKTKKRRLKALIELIDQERELADEVAANQAELVERTRDYNVTKKLYEEMLQRKENAKLTLALNDEGQGETYKLAETPVYPLKPEGISALFIFFAAPIVALCVPLGLVGALVVLDPRIRSVAILSQKIPDDVMVLASIPHRGTPIATRLLRKDIFFLLCYSVILIGGYVYTLYHFIGRL